MKINTSKDKEVTMKELLTQIAKALVDSPNEVDVKEVTGEKAIILEIKTSPQDRGKIIGRDGRIIKAIRIIMGSIGSKSQRKINVELVE